MPAFSVENRRRKFRGACGEMAPVAKSGSEFPNGNQLRGLAESKQTFVDRFGMLHRREMGSVLDHARRDVREMCFEVCVLLMYMWKVETTADQQNRHRDVCDSLVNGVQFAFFGELTMSKCVCVHLEEQLSRGPRDAARVLAWTVEPHVGFDVVQCLRVACFVRGMVGIDDGF